MKTIYKIKIHSFVDLITNSSTEIYIRASDKSIETLKKIIDNLLELGESKYKADDLFDFSLKLDELLLDDYITKKMIENHGEDVYIKCSGEQITKFIEEIVENVPKYIENDIIKNMDWDTSGEIYIKAKSKNDSELGKTTERMLSELHKLFSAVSVSDY